MKNGDFLVLAVGQQLSGEAVVLDVVDSLEVDDSPDCVH